ncbi:ATP-binding protein [Curtobacterium sp. MCJR17_043]|uniref:ATP-binding protein n=1 Tax=Curtobacterium sp. MCJR17_043 TaxID=2175660 RepID=UPI0032E88E73
MDDLDGLLEQILAGRAEANDLESESVDFKREQKSQQDTANDMADAAACFANANGGTIVLGVADRGTGRDAFLGTALDPQYLRRRIYDVTKPSLDVSVRPLQFAGVQLLVIEVREGLEVYSSRLKMPSKRVGHQCEPMSTAQVSRLDDDRRGGDWSAASAGRPPLRRRPRRRRCAPVLRPPSGERVAPDDLGCASPGSRRSLGTAARERGPEQSRGDAPLRSRRRARGAVVPTPDLGRRRDRPRTSMERAAPGRVRRTDRTPGSTDRDDSGQPAIWSAGADRGLPARGRS